MRTFPRLVLLPLVGTFGGFAAAAAGAQVAPPPPDPCATAFDDPTEPRLQMTMDPAPRSDARPGQVVRLAASWPTGQWDSLTAVRGCVEQSGSVDGTLSGGEDPPIDDGAYEHQYTVPDGLFNGTVLCHRMVVEGDPAGEATTARWVSKQGCVEVHPEETGPPPPTSTPPPAPPPAGPAAESPAPPAQPAAPQPPAATPPVASDSAPPPGGATGPVSPPPNDRPSGRFVTPAPVPGGPVELAELPRTGAAPLAPVLAGGVALAAGLAALLLGRRSGPAIVKARPRAPG